MKTRLILVSAFLLVTVMPFVSAQEDRVKPSAPEQENPGPKWVWAEVSSVDNKNSALEVKYMNYRTNQEERLSIFMDKDTKFKNVNSLEGIKPGNFASIDYADKDNKNIAVLIIVEKP